MIYFVQKCKMYQLVCGKSPSQCKDCGEQFSTDVQYRRHTAMHRNDKQERTHICEVNKSFGCFYSSSAWWLIIYNITCKFKYTQFCLRDYSLTVLAKDRPSNLFHSSWFLLLLVLSHEVILVRTPIKYHMFQFCYYDVWMALGET